MGFDEAYLDPLTPFNTWVRGTESLTLHDPRKRPQKLALIGLGLSEPADITAEVLVVKNYEELEAKKD